MNIPTGFIHLSTDHVYTNYDITQERYYSIHSQALSVLRHCLSPHAMGGPHRNQTGRKYSHCFFSQHTLRQLTEYQQLFKVEKQPAGTTHNGDRCTMI